VAGEDEVPIIRFKRGNDRRQQVVPVDHDRRAPQDGRRSARVSWLSLFHGADEAAVAEALDDTEILLLPPGYTLLRPGAQNDTVYLVLSGQLGAYLGNSTDDDRAIPIGPGECIGELSSIDGKPVSALVRTLTEARVLRLHGEVFWNRLMAVPGVARNLLSVLAERMRRNTETMLESQRREIELKHLRQELNVARQLQLGMLPMRRPLFPDRHDLEIAGLMEAASFIGGDLFDAFFVDEQRLFFCIGDVSGHGIPAAMFMARTVSLMRTAASSAECPALLLQTVNDQLCAGNDANMFVTLFCGFLEIDSGRVVYSNGGHLAPVLWCDGQASPLPIPKGTLIGVIPGISYARSEIELNRGDLILCYTDGVTEAQTVNGEEFSEPRLAGIVAEIAHQPLELLLDKVRLSVAEYSGDSKLADDCTMLAIRRPHG
jgi:sigma-B regulation protein RsbU (phosphoserine phosphatase)